MKNKLFIVMLIMLVALGWWLHLLSIEEGERLAIDNCSRCHDLSSRKENKTGPYLWGIVNRRAGIIDGFDYSEAFREFSDSRQYSWSEINLDLLITDPDQLIPDIRMAQQDIDSKHGQQFKNVQSLDNRRKLIVYLKTLN